MVFKALVTEQECWGGVASQSVENSSYLNNQNIDNNQNTSTQNSENTELAKLDTMEAENTSADNGNDSDGSFKNQTDEQTQISENKNIEQNNNTSASGDEIVLGEHSFWFNTLDSSKLPKSCIPILKNISSEMKNADSFISPDDKLVSPILLCVSKQPQLGDKYDHKDKSMVGKILNKYNAPVWDKAELKQLDASDDAKYGTECVQMANQALSDVKSVINECKTWYKTNYLDKMIKLEPRPVSGPVILSMGPDSYNVKVYESQVPKACVSHVKEITRIQDDNYTNDYITSGDKSITAPLGTAWINACPNNIAKNFYNLTSSKVGQFTNKYSSRDPNIDLAADSNANTCINEAKAALSEMKSVLDNCRDWYVKYKNEKLKVKSENDKKRASLENSGLSDDVKKAIQTERDFQDNNEAYRRTLSEKKNENVQNNQQNNTSDISKAQEQPKPVVNCDRRKTSGEVIEIPRSYKTYIDGKEINKLYKDNYPENIWNDIKQIANLKQMNPAPPLYPVLCKGKEILDYKKVSYYTKRAAKHKTDFFLGAVNYAYCNIDNFNWVNNFPFKGYEWKLGSCE